MYDLGQMIAKVEPEVLRPVGVDAMALLVEPRQWKPFTLQDGSSAEIPAGASVECQHDGGKPLLLHSCGSIRALMGTLTKDWLRAAPIAVE